MLSQCSYSIALLHYNCITTVNIFEIGKINVNKLTSCIFNFDLRKAVLNYEKKLAKESRNNPKAFYRYINSKTKSRCSIGTLETKQGELIEGNWEKAEALNKHFSSVFTKEGLGELPHFSQRSCQNQLQDMTFDVSEIKDKLLNLKTNKSPGPDKIHPRLLKEMHSVLSVPLQKLFTRLLQLGCPEAWKVGHITPVFKKGNKKDVSNYRPISLTSVTGKVMESLVRTRLMKHFTDNNFVTRPAWFLTRKILFNTTSGGIRHLDSDIG